MDERDYIHSSWHCIEFGEKRSKRTLGGRREKQITDVRTGSRAMQSKLPADSLAFPLLLGGVELGLGPDDRL